MPRFGSIEIIAVGSNTAYQFTPLGLVELEQLAVIGTPVDDMAEYFGVTATWLRKAMYTEEAVRRAINSGEGEGKKEVRHALHEAAKAGDARVLTFVAERRLKMNKVVENVHKHQISVIGTMPNHELPSGDWFDKFAPKDVSTQLEKESVPALPHSAQEEVEDAETE